MTSIDVRPARLRAGRQKGRTATAPLAIALHWGLTAGGVTTWGVRLANELARRGGRTALIIHKGPSDHVPVRFDIDPRVEILDLTGMPGLQEVHGDPEPFVNSYRSFIDRLTEGSTGPVVLSPNIFEESYGIAAALCTRRSDGLRIVAWQHNDNEYDTRILSRYEPIISGFAGVSRRVVETLRAAVPYRCGDIVPVPYGVIVPAEPPERPSLRDRPVRLLYAGRMEHYQKRVIALVHLSDELRRRGVRHELLLVGDGQAAGEIDRMGAERPSIRRLPAVSPEAVLEHMAWADAYVLSSRYEGLSVAMLEAMARGCVPIVTGVRSGVTDAIEPGVNGEVASSEGDDGCIAAGLADAVERFVSGDPAEMSRASWRTARNRYSIEAHADAAGQLVNAAAAGPARWWPPAWPVTLSGVVGHAVPPGGVHRTAAVLERLKGRRVVIHGVGQHTTALGCVFARSPAPIMAFADDDPARHGSRLWNWPVIGPGGASATGATDVVICSHTFQEAIWARRAVYEAQGLRVHRIYADDEAAGSGA